jgi:hypothetical protein
MRLMRPALALRWLAVPVAIALCAAAGRPASAEGVVRLSWDHPANSAAQVVDAKNYGGPGAYDLWVTVSGQSTPVHCFEIELYVQAARAGCQPAPAPPAAWRFDGAGCAAGRACFEWNSFSGDPQAAQAGGVFISELSFNPATGLERIVVAECNPVPLVLPDPAKTYTLGRFHFDHTGACAAETDSALITLTTAAWVPIAPDGSDGPEFEWASDAPVTLTWNVSGSAPPACNASATETPGAHALDQVCCQDPNMSPCALAVPARGTSWGQVKATYR